jgi:hypothetical protein
MKWRFEKDANFTPMGETVGETAVPTRKSQPRAKARKATKVVTHKWEIQPRLNNRR